MFERIQAMLDSCNSDTTVFPPTELYNETWLLRLALDCFSRQGVSDHFLSVPKAVTTTRIRKRGGETRLSA